jgi:hypothetical protein
MVVDPDDLSWLKEKLAEHVVSGAVEEAQCLDFIAAAFIVKSGAQQKRRLVVDLKDLRNTVLRVAGRRISPLRFSTGSMPWQFQGASSKDGAWMGELATWKAR